MMTFEEFKQLAIHPPQKQEKTIFHITTVDIDTEQSNYPAFSVNKYGSHAYAESLESAELLVHQFAEGIENLYCIYVTEYPMCERLCFGGNYVSQRVYGPDGTLIEQHLFCDFFTDERDKFRHYRGRLPEQIRFKEGDIVEVLQGDEVTLQVIVGVPPTVEWCYRYALRGLDTKYNPGKTDAEREQWAFEDGYMLDITDDSYTVIDGPDYDYHSHPDALCIFAPRFPIPANVEQALKGYYEAVAKQE